MTKIRDVLSDDKRDWELRVAAVSGPEHPVSKPLRRRALAQASPCFPAEEGSLAAPGRRRGVRRLPAAAAAHGSGVQTLRQGPALPGGPGGLHHPGVRLQAREPVQKGVPAHSDASHLLCLRHLSSVLGSRFDHAAEATMPILLNLVPNSAKVMATSGVAAIRLILRVRDVPPSP